MGCIPQYRSDLPLRNQAQFDIVDELVDSATAAGARELLGGNPDREAPGFFYPTTLVADIDPGNPLVVEEQFDPALPIVMYSTVDEAIQLANGLETGLGSSVWGTDRDATIRVAARLEAGTTWTNGHGGVDPRIPFGGAKQSGYGLEFGPMASSNLASPRHRQLSNGPTNALATSSLLPRPGISAPNKELLVKPLCAARAIVA